MTVRCPHCGTVNRSGSNYCNNCGASLRADDDSATAATAPGTAPETSESAAATEPLAAWAAAQPWLEAEAENDQPAARNAASGSDDEPSNEPPRRLIANVQGLLEPVRVFSEATDESDLSTAGESAPPALTFGADQLRRLRTLMSEEPLLVATKAIPMGHQLPPLRNLWVALLLAVAVALSFWLGRPPGLNAVAQQWPGVAEAYAALEQTPVGAPVLLLWDYDPATAGEMDLLALPLIAQLNARQNQIILVSLLPNGLTTARRTFVRASAPAGDERALRLAIANQQFSPGVFLPASGGALPLLGQDLAAALDFAPGVIPAGAQSGIAAGPRLAILLAAQAEDVQSWLEQVRPLNGLPTVAFTSAAADPVLRPYLASGQLAGLVTGFDGAASYHALSTAPLPEESEARLTGQLFQQSWGQLAFLLVIVLGNLAALWGRERDR